MSDTIDHDRPLTIYMAGTPTVTGNLRVRIVSAVNSIETEPGEITVARPSTVGAYLYLLQATANGANVLCLDPEANG